MVYFCLVLLVFIFWFIKECSIYRSTALINIFSYIVIIVLVLLAALRAPIVGADDVSFISDYESLKLYSFEQLYERWRSYFGYYALSKCFTLLGAPVQVWFAFLEFFYLYALYKLICAYSKDKILSLFVFICIGLMGSSFTHLKQILSASFVMLSFIKLIDRKYISSVLFFSMAFLSHNAALAFVFAYLLYFLRRTKFFYVYLMIGVVLLFIQQELLLNSYISITDNDHFEHYLKKDNTYSAVTFIYYLILFVISLISFNKYNKRNTEECRLVIGSCVIAICFQLYASYNPSLFRLANFYTPFFLILLPNSVSYSNNRRIMSTLMIGIMAFYLLYSMRDTPYMFMW